MLSNDVDPLADFPIVMSALFAVIGKRFAKTEIKDTDIDLP